MLPNCFSVSVVVALYVTVAVDIDSDGSQSSCYSYHSGGTDMTCSTVRTAASYYSVAGDIRMQIEDAAALLAHSLKRLRSHRAPSSRQDFISMIQIGAQCVECIVDKGWIATLSHKRNCHNFYMFVDIIKQTRLLTSKLPNLNERENPMLQIFTSNLWRIVLGTNSACVVAVIRDNLIRMLLFCDLPIVANDITLIYHRMSSVYASAKYSSRDSRESRPEHLLFYALSQFRTIKVKGLWVAMDARIHSEMMHFLLSEASTPKTCCLWLDDERRSNKKPHWIRDPTIQMVCSKASQKYNVTSEWLANPHSNDVRHEPFVNRLLCLGRQQLQHIGIVRVDSK